MSEELPTLWNRPYIAFTSISMESLANITAYTLQLNLKKEIKIKDESAFFLKGSENSYLCFLVSVDEIEIVFKKTIKWAAGDLLSAKVYIKKQLYKDLTSVYPVELIIKVTTLITLLQNKNRI